MSDRLVVISKGRLDELRKIAICDSSVKFVSIEVQREDGSWLMVRENDYSLPDGWSIKRDEHGTILPDADGVGMGERPVDTSPPALVREVVCLPLPAWAKDLEIKGFWLDPCVPLVNVSMNSGEEILLNRNVFVELAEACAGNAPRFTALARSVAILVRHLGGTETIVVRHRGLAETMPPIDGRTEETAGG